VVCPEGQAGKGFRAVTPASPELSGRLRHALVSGTSFGSFLQKTMLTALLLLAGLVCFGLFFKSIDFFDKI
jgi:hypothetical protein